MNNPRAYRQVARAASTDQIRARIVDAFAEAVRAKWMSEITLDAVAATAGTTRQTVIRMFGGKDGLMAAVAERIAGEVVVRRALPPAGDLAEAAAQALSKDYEASGDMVLRLLAQEEAHPPLAILLAVGRREHRKWVAETFAEALGRYPDGPLRDLRLDLLIAATDVYTWKLWRRDMGHDSKTVILRMAFLVRGILEKGESTNG